MTSIERDELKRLLQQRSLQSGGNFKLASGQSSSVYIDARLTTCSASGTRLIGKAFLAKMTERGWQPQAVGGMSIGADPIVISIARESLESGRAIDGFLVRKEVKQHGMQRAIEGIANVNGVSAVIVDDVCTTGGSTVKAIEQARAAGMNVLGAICLVDREAGGRENIEVALNCTFDRIFTMNEVVEAAVPNAGS